MSLTEHTYSVTILVTVKLANHIESEPKAGNNEPFVLL